jgi:hypothetical protein
VAVEIDGTGVVPEDRLPTRQLVLASVYWLGLATIFAGLSSILAGRLRYEGLVPPGTEGSALFQMTAAGIVVAIIVQPTIGAISDQTVTRFGRRMPYSCCRSAPTRLRAPTRQSGSSAMWSSIRDH